MDMKDNKAKFLVVAWFLCLVVSVYQSLAHYSPSVPAVLGAALIPGFLIYLGYRLYKQPSRKLTAWFSVMCLLVLLKFCFGNILYFYSLSHSFSEACHHWLKVGTSGVFSFIDTIGITILVPITFYYWPLYCFGNKTKNEQLVPGANAANDAVK